MDNTLYDWRAHFCTGFERMLPALSDLIGESTAALKKQFRQVHCDEGHMEWVSALHRLPSVLGWIRHEPERVCVLERVVRELLEHGRASLRPYVAVKETLSAMASDGWTVVVFTESPAIPTAQRLRAMNLLEFVQVVYGAAGCSDQAAPVHANVVTLPAFVKPAPEMLLRILARHGASAVSTIYVGDSLARDMHMARSARVPGVWARYGSSAAEKHRAVIAEVSCWASEKVNRELASRPGGEDEAHLIIDCFGQLPGALATRHGSSSSLTELQQMTPPAWSGRGRVSG